MNNGEFYGSGEVNYIGENKSFPSELYRKPSEENSLGRELADLGRESTTLGKKRNVKRGQNEGGAKSLVEQVFNSIRSVATATVAVSAIVVTGTAISSTVNAELVSIDVGSSYVEYAIDVKDATDNLYMIVSSADEIYSEIKVEESGIKTARAEGLRPEWEYLLSLVSRDPVLGDITHFKHSFQTKKNLNFEPPDSYTGSYYLPDIESLSIDYADGSFTLPIRFENPEGRYCYLVTVSGEDGSLLEAYSGTDDEDFTVKIREGVDVYKLGFEIYGVGETEELLLVSEKIGDVVISMPRAEVTSTSIIGENLVRVNLEIADIDLVALRLDYPDGESEEITLTDGELLRGYKDVYLPETALSLVITPIITYGDTTRECESFAAEFKNNLEVDTFIRLGDGESEVSFNVRAITNQAYYLHISSDNGAVASGDYGFYDNITVPSGETVALTLYLTDGEGTKLSNEVTVSVNASSEGYQPSYTILNHPNPSEVGITYNDDGTINVYIYTGFSPLDEECYSLITLGAYSVRSREGLTVFEGLPNETYPLNYKVCYERGGVQYIVESVTPSGTVNEIGFREAYYLSGNEFSLYLGDPPTLDLDTLKILTSGGEEILISSGDFVTDEDGNLMLNITLKDSPEYVILSGMHSPFAKGLLHVDEYKGEAFIPFEFEITQG